MNMSLKILAISLLATPAVTAQTGTPGAHFLENWDLDGDGVVTVMEAKERREAVFLSFDADEDGFLDAEEYVYFDDARANDAAEHGSGTGARRAQTGMTLEFNDTDADGRVSAQEFLSKAGDWLALIDRNADGAVTTADFGPNSKNK